MKSDLAAFRRMGRHLLGMVQEAHYLEHPGTAPVHRLSRRRRRAWS